MAVHDQPRGRSTATSAADDRPVVVLGGSTEPAGGSVRRLFSPGRSFWLGLAVGAALATLVLLGWRLASDHDTSAVPVAGTSPDATLVPDQLSLDVALPDSVVAGQPAIFRLTYRDGQGVFSGGTEDWGDAGAGSGKQGTCTAGAPAAGSVRGSYTVRHTWPEAGSYPAALSVTTYTCVDGTALEETKTTRLTVRVAAR